MTVSIVIPTYNRTALLLDRSLPSALAQTDPDIEVLIVGDGTEQATVDAMASVTDPRVSFTNLPHHVPLDDPQAEWCSLGAAPAAWGIAHATGDWVTVLGDDDALDPHYIERLRPFTADADVIYPRAEVVGHGCLGSWPPRPSGFVNTLWRRSTGFTLDPESWRRGIVCDWDMWSRMLAAGLRWVFVDEVLYRYFPANRVPVVDEVAA